MEGGGPSAVATTATMMGPQQPREDHTTDGPAPYPHPYAYPGRRNRRKSIPAHPTSPTTTPGIIFTLPFAVDLDPNALNLAPPSPTIHPSTGLSPALSGLSTLGAISPGRLGPAGHAVGTHHISAANALSVLAGQTTSGTGADYSAPVPPSALGLTAFSGSPRGRELHLSEARMAMARSPSPFSLHTPGLAHGPEVEKPSTDQATTPSQANFCGVLARTGQGTLPPQRRRTISGGSRSPVRPRAPKLSTQQELPFQTRATSSSPTRTDMTQGHRATHATSRMNDTHVHPALAAASTRLSSRSPTNVREESIKPAPEEKPLLVSKAASPTSTTRSNGVGTAPPAPSVKPPPQQQKQQQQQQKQQQQQQKQQAAPVTPPSPPPKTPRQRTTSGNHGQGGETRTKTCYSCGTTRSAQSTWRTGWSDNVTLCNQCGLRYGRNGHVHCLTCNYVPSKSEVGSNFTVCRNCQQTQKPLP